MSCFVICIDNTGCEESLLIGKVYVQRPDAPAEAEQMLRVVDEDTSEPDGYLYPSAFFVPVVLPEKAQRAVLNSLG